MVVVVVVEAHGAAARHDGDTNGCDCGETRDCHGVGVLLVPVVVGAVHLRVGVRNDGGGSGGHSVAVARGANGALPVPRLQNSPRGVDRPRPRPRDRDR